MQLRKMSAAIAFVAIAGIGGALGQSLSAQANSAPLTDKTIYGKANPGFTSSLTATPGTTQSVMAITVHAPSAGQAVVSLNTQLWTDFPSTTTSRLTNVVSVARCGAPNTLAPPCAALSTYWFHKEQNAGSDDSTFPFSITSQLNFPSSGNRTIYLNVRGSTYNAGLWGDTNAHIDVQFTPKNPISNNSQVSVSATTA